MRKSIVFGGVDFSDITRAEVAEVASPVVSCESVAVPGRDGAVLLGTTVAPRDVTVRLMLDAAGSDEGSIAHHRARIAAALCAPGGHVLELPGGLRYRDCVCVAGGAWTTWTGDGTCDVVFRAFDPIAYGSECESKGLRFDVGGSWPTWPTITLRAESAASVAVSCGSKSVTVETGFSGGELVVIDMAEGTATVDGLNACADIALESDFFALAPGECLLQVSNCSLVGCSWEERWA